MNLDHFKKEINQLDSEFLQSIIDGAALTMHQDESLRLGKSHEAFVIFWVEGEEISSLQELQDYLADQGCPHVITLEAPRALAFNERTKGLSRLAGSIIDEFAAQNKAVDSH